jgi:hypothetical protein
VIWRCRGLGRLTKRCCSLGPLAMGCCATALLLFAAALSSRSRRCVCSHLASRQGRADTFRPISLLLKAGAVRLLDLRSPQGRCGDFTRVLVLSKARRYVYSRLPSPQGAHLPSGYRLFPDADLIADQTQSPPSSPIRAQFLFSIHQRNQVNVWQPISMTFLSIAASDVGILILSAHSLDSLSLPNFSTAHRTHPEARFRHPTPT